MRGSWLLPIAVLLAGESCGRIGYEDVADLGLGAGDGGGFHPMSSGGSASGAIGLGGGSSGAAIADGAANGDGGSGDPGGSSSGGAPADAGGSSSNDAAATGDATSGGIAGCADGQREGFLDTAAYPNIAACAGGWTLPGVVGLTGPACGRGAGNDGSNPNGTGCNASDLCATGFHLCANAAEVAAKSPTGCTGAVAGTTPVFFVIAQNSSGQAQCTTSGTNDIFGCGSLGAPPNANCAPLDEWSGNRCTNLTAPWSCGTTGQLNEGVDVVKPGPDSGGVVCCRD